MLRVLREANRLQSDGYSGAEIAAICQDAAFTALEHNLASPMVSQSNLIQAIHNMPKRITQDMIDFYTQFHKSINV